MISDTSSKLLPRKVGVVILILDKTDFKLNIDKQDKEGHYIIKGSIHQGDITTVNICT